MSLYIVTLSVDVVVQADSVEAAREVALDGAANEVDLNGGNVFAPDSETTITRLSQVAPEWQDSPPYGGDGTRTVREILGGES